MGIRWWSSGDAAAFKCLLALAAMYAVMSYVAHTVIYVRHVRPLGLDAPPDRFSEARTVEHIRYLTVDIDGRQEGRPGLDEAARYIKKQLVMLKERAGPGFRSLWSAGLCSLALEVFGGPCKVSNKDVCAVILQLSEDTWKVNSGGCAR